MGKDDSKRPNYGTWIKGRRVAAFWACGIILAALSLLGLVTPRLSLLGLLCLPFVYIAAVLSVTVIRLSERGGNYQNRIHDLILDSLGDEGSVLDIGCGSGNLIIKTAKAHPDRRAVGVDYWGDDWEYSRRQCVENASVEGAGSVEFVRGSAASLPFDDNSFDNVVSCLTFHEVRDATDKTEPLGEALRILRPGGRFVFFDLFDEERHFGGFERVATRLADSGGHVDCTKKLSEIMRLGFPLSTRKVLGRAVLITGKKQRGASPA